MAKLRSDPDKPINYLVSGIKGMKGYANVLELVEAQLGKGFDHKYDGKQGVVMFTTNVEIDTSRLSKSGLIVKTRQ